VDLTKNLEELKALIALKMCEGVGDMTALKLIRHCGSAVAVLREKNKHLSTIPGITDRIYDQLNQGINWASVDKEFDFIVENNIGWVSFQDPQYPSSLRTIDAPPLMLFYTGPLPVVQTNPCISIVGTRFATAYGLQFVEDLVSALKDTGVVIISGLAIGIDIAAHKEAIRSGLSTYGVVAHGIKTIYPSIHRGFARALPGHNSGILTEFFSGEIPNRENFPKRNRIIAGLSGTTIVVEAAKKGGALITADFAKRHKRKLYVLPGRYNDRFSEGCNLLLKSKVAQPVLSVASLLEDLNLSSKKTVSPAPTRAPLSLEEQKVIGSFGSNKLHSLDHIADRSSFSISQCAS